MHWGKAGQEDSRMAAMDFEMQTNSIAAVGTSAHMDVRVRGLSLVSVHLVLTGLLLAVISR